MSLFIRKRPSQASNASLSLHSNPNQCSPWRPINLDVQITIYLQNLRFVLAIICHVFYTSRRPYYTRLQATTVSLIPRARSLVAR